MTISKIGSGTPASRRRKLGSVSDPSATDTFKDHIQDGSAPAASGVTASAPLTALSTILAIQETPSAISERQRALLQGDSLLNELTALQIGLVEGTLSEETLRRVGQLLGQPRPHVDDRELNEVLDEIEVRAAVELAKLERNIDLEIDEA